MNMKSKGFTSTPTFASLQSFFKGVLQTTMFQNKSEHGAESNRAVKTIPKLVSGFTLIELLVVIAIIGILASVVLASLNSARAKGADAAVKSGLANIRAQAQIYYDANSSYGTTFAAAACNTSTTAGEMFKDDTKIVNIITGAGTASNGGGLASGSCVSTKDPDAWAVSVPLKTVTTDSWCVDSTGASKQVTPAGGDLGFSSAACK